ncbi:MAG: hypothetical protein Kow0090_07850 [Myxococcota bacterium]
MKYIDRQVNVPLCTVSTTTTLPNKTGSWKYSQPVFNDKVAPCNQQCPAGEDIEGYMYLVGRGRFEDAWHLIRQENPFPAIMGRVCFHTCELRCNRIEHDEGISINAVERFIGDYGISKGLKPKSPPPQNGKRIAVVGSGPAGLAVAYHLRMMGYGAIIFDKDKKAGGVMRYGIPEYRLPKKVLDAEIELLSDIAVKFSMETFVGRDISFEELEKGYDAVFFAPGVHKERELGVKGEDMPGVIKGLDFLRAINTGKRPDIGRKVAIIGGGNTAMDCARSAIRLGAEVTVIYRRTEAEMPANLEEIEMAKEEGVKFLFLVAPKEILGKNKILGAKLQLMKLGEPDESGRRKPVPIKGKYQDVRCSTMILAIGEEAKVGEFPPEIEHEWGTIVTDKVGRTSRNKFFAGGDVINIPRTVTDAIGSGKRSAVAIDRFISGNYNAEKLLENYRVGKSGNIWLARLKDEILLHRNNPTNDVVEYNNINSFYFDNRPRVARPRLPLEKRKRSFAEVVRPLPEKKIVEEALRCFNCGVCNECGNCYLFCPDNAIKKVEGGYGYFADMDYCKGCGVCAQECPRNAMRMDVLE